jgi:hypothetical protein
MPRQSLGFALLIILALGTGGCARPVETRIAGIGVGLTPPARVAALVPDEDGPAVDLKTQAIVEAALVRQAYVVVTDGDYLFDFSLSDRPTAVGIVSGAGGQPLSAAKPGKATKSCAKRTHRMTLSVVNSKTGQVVYRGSAEEYHCRGALGESATALADALAVDLKRPKSAAISRRKARN